MRRKLLLFAIPGIIALGIAARYFLEIKSPPPAMPDNPQRIVSLAPGITETLFALGLGNRVVGVTSFCQWPPEATHMPKVAGFRELNLEAIARTKPDLVILPDDMAHFVPQIENMGLAAITFEGRTLNGFLADVKRLGEICHVEPAAKKLVSAFNKALAAANAAGKIKPTVLFAIMSPDECGRPITELTFIGADGFYNELIEVAGGKNAYQGSSPYPRMSAEAILSLNPDVIVAAAPDWTNISSLKENWEKIGPLQAVKNGQLLLLTDPGHTIPGPRSIHTLNLLLATISDAARQLKAEKQ